MERYERAVAGQREGEEEQGGEVPVPGAVAGAAEGGMAREAASSDQEDISGTGNAGGHGAAESESDYEEEENKVIFNCSGDASDGSEFRNAPFLTLLSLFIGAGRSDGGVGGGRSGGQCRSWGRLQERPERGP